MQHVPSPEERPDGNPPPDGNAPNETRAASLTRRLDRAADALNPFLVLLVVGLGLLDLTLYVGLTVSRQPFVWTAPQHLGGAAPDQVGAAGPVHSAGPHH